MIPLAIKTFILFSNEFLSIQGDIFALIDYYFKINIFNILTGEKQDMTELKFVWPVSLPGNCPKIILSPALSLFVDLYFNGGSEVCSVAFCNTLRIL